MRHGRWRFLAGALIPALVLHVVFVLSPYAQAFYLSLTDWTGVAGEAHFVGAGNYARLGGDSLFLDAVRNNAVMLVVVPLVTIGIGLFLASMMHLGGRDGRRGIAGSGAYQIVYFFPQLLSLVVIAVLWGFVYNPNNGLLNGGLRAVGLDGLARSWLASPSLALSAVMAVLVWSSVGFYVVLFSAAMQSIPRDIYEAALLDGADRLRTLVRITVPLVWDTIQVAWVYLAILAIDGFAVVQIVTNGGPGFSSDVVGLRLYRTAFGDAQFGYASAIGVAMFFLTLSVAALFLRVTRRDRVEL